MHATLRYRNLVGQRYLALDRGAGRPARRCRPDGLIPSRQTTPALDLTVLFNGFRPLFTALDAARRQPASRTRSSRCCRARAARSTDLLQHTASLTTTLADRDAVIGQVITNLNAVLTTLDGTATSCRTTDRAAAAVRLRAGRRPGGDRLRPSHNIGGLTVATASLLQPGAPGPRAPTSTGLGIAVRHARATTAPLSTAPVEAARQYQALTGTASDGSWFNFFLCGFDGQIRLPKAGSVNPADFSHASARCPTGGGR